MTKTSTSKLTSTNLIIMAGLVLLAFSAWGWWRWVYSSPAKVFDRMVANSLATPSAYKHVVQGDEGQQLVQQLQLVTTPKPQVHSVSVLRQGPGGTTTVTTESIGTPKADFVRYMDIKTDQKNSEGKPFNFASVLGAWGKATSKDNDTGGVQLLNQTLFGVVLMADLPASQRAELVSLIKNNQVYKTDFSTVKRQSNAGRPVYSYAVIVQPVEYVTMLKLFARDLGLEDLERVDPGQYKDSQPLEFTLDIDVWSAQLIKVTYQGSPKTEAFSGYGVRTSAALPTTVIPVMELQNRLQQIR